MDVGAWLTALGLERYAQAFADNDIDAQTLRELTAEELKELGVTSLGHRKRILAAIAEIGAPEGDAAPRPRLTPASQTPSTYTPPYLAERVLTKSTRSSGLLAAFKDRIGFSVPVC